MSIGFENSDKATNNILQFTVGSKLEARDSSGLWYAARVEKVDSDRGKILIHFDGWNVKFDEWVDMNSDRIRAVKPPPPKAVPKFERGDQVLAQWGPYQKAPAVVQKHVCDGKYELLFEDGYIKRLPPSKIWPLDVKVKVEKSSSIIGSKQDRRDRKRKLIVSELFKSYSKKSKTESDSPKAEKVPSPGPSTSTTASPVSSHSSPLPPTPVSPPIEASTSDPNYPTPIPLQSGRSLIPFAPPTSVDVAFADGHTEVWTKFLVQRSEGKTAGKVEVVFMAPNGRKFRSRMEVLRFCDDNKVVYDPYVFDFSAKRKKRKPGLEKPSSEGSPIVITPETPATPDPPPAAIATPVQPSAPATPTPVIPTVAPAAVVPATSLPIEPIGQERKFIGDMEIVVEDGQIICPVQTCRKHFRRENLLHMHMKHYHPELTKFLDYTPSVTDLACARTGGGSLEQELGSSPVRSPAIRPETRSSSTTTLTNVSGGATTIPEVKRNQFKMKDCRVEVKPIVGLDASFMDTPIKVVSDVKEPDSSTKSFEVPPPVETENTAEVSPQPKTAPIQQESEVKMEATDKMELVTMEDVEALIPVATLQKARAVPHRSKIHWKRRAYRGKQLSIPDWYGRMAKQSDSSDGTGKQTDSADLVQKNPILNTLLNSRPLAPPLGWRRTWRKRRRGGLKKRRIPPRPLPHDPSDATTAAAAALSPAERTYFKEEYQGGQLDGVGLLDANVTPIQEEKCEKLRGNEIINCSCQIKEEDGLMIQCDVCLCWQHGHCLGMSPTSNVPESYVCSICKDPFKGRSSKKYYNHQDWLKQGVLPTLSRNENNQTERQQRLKRAFELSGQLSLLTRLLHSLRVKINVASNKNHPKLWLWAKKWVENKPAVSSSESESQEVDEKPPLISKAPEPEKPIDPIECKLNLLDHIHHYQDLVQERLDALEIQITELEQSTDDAPTLGSADDYSRTTATIKMILRDLETVKKIATFP